MIEELLHTVAQNLDNSKIPYMIIGGQAVLVYGTPRFTRDIDITLGVDTDKFALINKVCVESGLKILPEDPVDFVMDTKVLPAEEPESRIRVDFIFSFTEYESQAIKRAKEIQIDNYPVEFASCEDVIIHKMIAARQIDIEDVKNILIKNSDSISTEYINNWLLKFSEMPGHEDILKKFENILEE